MKLNTSSYFNVPHSNAVSRGGAQPPSCSPAGSVLALRLVWLLPGSHLLRTICKCADTCSFGRYSASHCTTGTGLTCHHLCLVPHATMPTLLIPLPSLDCKLLHPPLLAQSILLSCAQHSGNDHTLLISSLSP